ncbi:transposase family protein [Staphylococcus saprophyticus]|uniref:helix-turn-helix transcriptional regulator n=1 Tax=Staphylococcus saprophyticus TaxID=29385 RepID=UPI001888FFF1|nr:helix-turn-helix domain-containing protein [Staphylococcus saprophyticus]MBF2780672.1 transposase family protein [Staphylococcus saprophyticus]
MYNENEIRQLIIGYSWRQNLLEDKVYQYDSTSIGQYGIESVMSNGQGGTGDKVLVRVIQNDRDNRHSQKLIEELDFVDKYENCITNDKNYHILQLLKRGEKIKTIERLLNISERTVYDRVKAIVKVYMEQQAKHN